MAKGRRSFFMVLVLALVLFGAGSAVGITGKSFAVRSFLPKGTVTGSTQVKAVFSQNVVTSDDIGRKLDMTEMPFFFTPQIEGEGRWTDEKTFVFTPRGGYLTPATSYTALANPWLSDLEGRKLTGAKSFTFATAPLKFISATQTGFSNDARNVTYVLEFSLPVWAQRLKGFLTLRDGQGNLLDFSLGMGKADNLVVLTMPYRDKDGMELTIAKGLTANTGTLGLEKDVKVKLRPAFSMTILDSNIQSGARTASSIVINTSAPVDFAKAGQFIELSPKSDFVIEPHSRGFMLTGKFKPQDRVTVTIKKGLPSLTGDTLEQEWQRAFIFPNKEPQVKLDAAGRVITPAGLLRLAVEAVNLDKINVQVWKLYENNIVYAMREEWYSFPTDLSVMLSDKDYTVAGKPNETTRRALDLKPILGGEKGVFLVTARARDSDWWSDSRTVLNVTDLGITAKLGPESAFAWVNSIQTGEPVYGAKVTFWSWQNQPIAEAETNIRGIAEAKLPEGQSSQPVLATVSKGGDVAFVRLNNGLYGGKDDIDTGGANWLYGGYSAFCYMPRDIFRPGETVPFRAVVRGVNNVAPQSFPLTVKFISPSGKEWAERSAKLTEAGTIAIDMEFPADVQTGTWTARVFAPGSNAQIGYKQFMIEEFAPPRLFVDVSVDKKRLVGSDSAGLNISARYAFGASASGLPWEVTQNAVHTVFSPEGWGKYSFYDTEASGLFTPESSHTGSGNLGEDGTVVSEITSREWKVPSMLRVSSRVGVMEEGGRWVYKSVNLDWFPRQVMVGISLPQDRNTGKALEIGAAAVTIDGEAAAVKKLDYKIFRKVSQRVAYESGGTRHYRTQTELLERAKGEIKIEEGKGSVPFTPSQRGTYLVRVEDPASGAKASMVFYVHDARYYGGDSDEEEDGAQESNHPDRVEVVTDKKEYKAGEVVRVNIKAPFSGRVLLGVETYKMAHSIDYDMRGKKEAEISFRANEFMLPNAWITVQVIQPAKKRVDGEPFRAYGAAPLVMDNSGTKLTVEIDKIGVVEPGPLDVNLTVKDSRGSGAAAEVTVMLVDETVLGLTGWQRPDPWAHFTARRRLGMETYDLYNAILSPEDEATPLLTAGGDGYDAEASMMKASQSPVKAQRFKILTVSETVKTGSNGKATVRLNVPEFAGTARLTAVAVSAKAMGSGDGPAGINREIVLEPSLPRALAPKDVLTAPLTVFNMADRDMDVNITVTPSGPLKLNDGGKFTLKVKAGGSVSRELAFTGTGSGVARVAFVAEWEGGKIEDTIELPVRPASPRVSSSSSMILEAGKSEKINLDGDWFPGTKSGRVMLSAMPQISIANVADFLITYPYGCLEQTVSSAWPLLMMPELVAAIDPALATKKSLEGALTLRIQRIRGLQNPDGGFSRWRGWTWSNSWDSFYATHLLIEAKKRGADVPDETINAALSFMRRMLSAAPADDSSRVWNQMLTTRAYACYVLALAGEKQLGWMSSIYDHEKNLSPSARLLLAAAYAEAGEKKQAAAMMGKSFAMIKAEPGGSEIYDSNLRNRALTLLAWTHIDPVSAEAAAAAMQLLNSFKATRYYSTQEGGFSLLALGRYFSAQPQEGKPAGALKDASGKTIAELDEKTGIISADIGEQNTFTMVNSGKARLFAASTIGGVPTKPVEPVDSGIMIRQSLQDRNGNEITDSVRRGEALTATVVITPTAGRLCNIVVSIPLTAGLEVENPQLTGGKSNLPYNSRVELRDDRVLLFLEVLSQSVTWSYSVRPVTAGKFAVPQISAECMYDPGVQSISGGGTLDIRNAE